jgi:hypothetical protein
MPGKQIKIAISGKARSGKNTLASLLVKNMGLDDTNSKLVALADPMKKIIELMFPEADSECLFGPSELRSKVINDNFIDANNKPLTYRQALIDLGAFGRKYNSDIWLSCLIGDAKKSTDKLAYVITDCRYINEYNYLKGSGFYCIRVLRDDHSKINDTSETEQDLIDNSGFDYIVYNNGSLEELSKITYDIIEKLKKV